MLQGGRETRTSLNIGYNSMVPMVFGSGLLLQVIEEMAESVQTKNVGRCLLTFFITLMDTDNNSTCHSIHDSLKKHYEWRKPMSLRTEKEAVELYCPEKAKVTQSSVNYDHSCEASHCMMWRWEPPSDERLINFEEYGYCGLAGKVREDDGK